MARVASSLVPERTYCRGGRGSQFAVEEFGGCAVSADPITPAKKVVNFVGDNQLFERDFLGAEFFDPIGGLLERHVAIVLNIFSQQQPIGLENHFQVNCVARGLSTFPG